MSITLKKFITKSTLPCLVYIDGTYYWYVSIDAMMKMDTAKLFQTGRSQAVRLPKEFRMPGKEVKIHREGNKIILEPLGTTWEAMWVALEEFPDDFMASGREQPGMQERDGIL